MPSSLQKGIDSAKLGQMDLALSHLKDAIIEEPENANVWVWLAAIIEDENKQAIFLSKALEIDPDNRPAQRGMAYIERKKTTPPRPGEKLSDHTKPIGLFGRDVQSSPHPFGSSGIPDQVDKQTSERTITDAATPTMSRERDTDTPPQKTEKKDRTPLLDVFLYIFILLVFIFIGILVGSTLLKIDLPFISPVEKTIDLPALPATEGYYLYDQSDYALIKNHIGAPEYEEGIPSTINTQPYVLLNQIEAGNNALVFQYEDGTRVEYSLNSINTNTSLLVPNGELQSGLYCLISANSDTSELPNYWCFRIK